MDEIEPTGAMANESSQLAQAISELYRLYRLYRPHQVQRLCPLLCNKSKSHHKFQDYQAHLVASHTNQLPRSLSSTVLPVTIYFFTLLFRRYKCITPFSFSFSVIISLAHSDSKNLVWRGNSWVEAGEKNVLGISHSNGCWTFRSELAVRYHVSFTWRGCRVLLTR